MTDRMKHRFVEHLGELSVLLSRTMEIVAHSSRGSTDFNVH